MKQGLFGSRAIVKPALALPKVCVLANGRDQTGIVVVMSNSFIQAAVIVLREGLEAMLVIAALAGYLVKVGSGNRVNALYLGAFAAVIASVIGAWAFAVFNSGDHSDTLEAVVILFAAALMLYVSGWLMVKQDPRGWQDYLAQKADAALARDTGIAVALLAFFAVFREGAETILFLVALASTEGGWNAGLIGGICAALAGLVVIFYFLNQVARKIPLRPLFIVTSAFLFVMAIKFIGDAIQELQEQAIVPVTEVKGFPILGWLGLNATVEALSIQFLIILMALASYLFVQRNARLTREATAKH